MSRLHLMKIFSPTLQFSARDLALVDDAPLKPRLTDNAKGAGRLLGDCEDNFGDMEGSNMFKRIIRNLSIVVRGLAVVALFATASYAQGVHLVKVGWDTAHPNGNPVVAFDSPDLLKTAFDTAWNLSRAPIRDAIKKAISKGDALGPGYTAHPDSIVCNMAPSGTLQIASSGDQITLTYLVKGNYLEFTSTQPTACGSECDPRISFTYDLLLTATINVPTTTQSLSFGTVSVQVQNAGNFDSHNFAGDVAKAVADIIKFFGGPDFVAMLANKIDQQRFDFTNQANAALAPVNQLLQQLAQAGYSLFGGSFDPIQKKLMLRAAAPLTTIKVSVGSFTDHVKVDPQYASRVNTYPQVNLDDSSPYFPNQGGNFSLTFPKSMAVDRFQLIIYRDVKYQMIPWPKDPKQVNDPEVAHPPYKTVPEAYRGSILLVKVEYNPSSHVFTGTIFDTATLSNQPVGTVTGREGQQAHAVGGPSSADVWFTVN